MLAIRTLHLAALSLAIVLIVAPATQAQTTTESLADLVERYESEFTSLAYKFASVQEILSEDPTRPKVIADITTNVVEMKIKDGAAAVRHQAYIGPDDTGERLEASVNFVDVTLLESYSQDGGAANLSEDDAQRIAEVFRHDLVLSYTFLPPPGFDRKGLSWMLRLDDVVVEGQEQLFGEELTVCRLGETKLWIDTANGGILRRLEERRSGRLRKVIEVPELIDAHGIYFPATIHYTSYNRTQSQANAEPVPYVQTTITIDPDSLRINDIPDNEPLI